MNPKRLYLFSSLIFAVIINPASSGKSAAEVAADLMHRYRDTARECHGNNNDKRPAYECSGIMIRGVNNRRKLRYPWSIKPFNKKKESFPMAYLRDDVQWSRLPFGYDAGFIMFPQLKTPSGKNSYKVFCAFPLDAWTDNRGGKHACGKNKDAIGGESHHCQAQGINTFEKWRKHFHRVKPRFSRNQCGFDMTSGSSPKTFRTFLKAAKFLEKYRFNRKAKYKFADPNNEILVHAWNDKNPKALPIEAFFYVKGTKGKAYAQKYQKQFQHATGGEKVPIVSIQFPSRKKKRPFKVTPL